MASNETYQKPKINEGVAGVPYYVPKTEPSPGALLPPDIWPSNKKDVLLFKPLKVRDVTFKNRLWVSPMCQYSCASGTGVHTDWHLVHLGGFAKGGAGLVMVEATSVTPEGLISPEDSGLWNDEQIPPLKREVDFIHSQGAVAAIQLGHAGRKASTYAPWLTDGLLNPKDKPKLSSMIAKDDEAGWRTKVLGPSAVAFDEKHATPQEMTVDEIKGFIAAYVAAAKRALKAGFDLIEIHTAHGYLLHEFFSPVSNKRTDQYGGSLENRIRIATEVVTAVREVIPAGMPLFLRLSASDWHEEGEQDAKGNWVSWGPLQSIELVKAVQKLGVDLIDTSSGGNYSGQQIKIGPSYQVPFAAQIKKAIPSMLIGAVGLLTNAKQVEEHLQKGEVDAVFAAREFLRDPNFPITAAYDLGVVVGVPVQYERAHTRMYKPQ